MTTFDKRMKRWVHDATWRVAAKFDGLGNLTIGDIAILVARSFNLMVADITGKSQFWIDQEARHIVIVLACRFTDLAIADIGHWCGVSELSVDRAREHYDDMIDEMFAALELPIPPRRLAMNSRDVKVLQSLYLGSEDGEFSCTDDVLPKDWSTTFGNRTLNRLKSMGLAECQTESTGTLSWWRITPAGRDIIGNMDKRSQALRKQRILQRQRRHERLKEAA